jgi:ATP-binding cassette subfamily B protein
MQSPFEEHYRQVDHRYRAAQAANIFISAAPRYVIEAAGIVVIGLMALFLSFQPGGLAAAIPILGALALGAQRLLPLLQQAYVGWSQFAGSAELLREVIELVHAPVVADAAPGDAQPLTFSRDIVFDRVSLSYPDRPNALRDINLRIAKGEHIGIMGPSGSGKSSLLDVLTGLLLPSFGEVRVDGAPITDENRGRWQRHVAHVPQSVYLPDCSISECIAFGEAPLEIDAERVEQAARRAQMHEFIINLPSGYATQVGERGVRLSGGQRQRIAIARALYKEASLIIFDEATAALDAETEAEIMNSLDGLGREVTLLIVSHRLSALQSCDAVVTLKAGTVVAKNRVERSSETSLLNR